MESPSDRVRRIKAELANRPYCERLREAVTGAGEARGPNGVRLRIYSPLENCRKLAGEAVENPELLDIPAWRMLAAAGSVFSSEFFIAAGEGDAEGRLRGQLQDRAKFVVYAALVGYYVKGWLRRDADAAEAWVCDRIRFRELEGVALDTLLNGAGASLEIRKRLVDLIRRERAEPADLATALYPGRWLADMPAKKIADLIGCLLKGAGLCVETALWILSGRLGAGPDFPAELVEPVLNVIDRFQSLSGRVWDPFENICERLAEAQIDAAFKVVERRINALKSAETSERERLWTPFTAERARFWDALRTNDPKRAYALLLGLEGHLDGVRLAALLDLEAHSDTVASLAVSSSSNVRFYAGLMFGSQPGYFPMAYALMEAFPDDAELSKTLSTRLICHEGKATLQERFKMALKAVEGQLDSWHTPNTAMPWLKEQLHKIHIRMSYVGA